MTRLTHDSNKNGKIFQSALQSKSLQTSTLQNAPRLGGRQHVMRFWPASKDKQSTGSPGSLGGLIRSH